MANVSRFVAALTVVLLLLTQGELATGQTQYQLVRTIGSSGSGNGQLEDPFAVALDASGDVFVADYGNSRIDKFSNRGAYLGQIDGLSQCVSVAVAQSGDVYGASFYSGTVSEFTNNGAYLAS